MIYMYYLFYVFNKIFNNLYIGIISSNVCKINENSLIFIIFE